MKLNFNKNLVFASLLVLAVFAGMSSISAHDVDAGTNDAIYNGNFVMTVPYNAGTGYHWEISQDSYGVEVNSVDFVEDHPGTFGSSGTGYFNFHVIDNNNYYVKLVLISPTGDIVKEIDSNMLN